MERDYLEKHSGALSWSILLSLTKNMITILNIKLNVSI